MIKEVKLPEIADNVDTATVISIQVSKGDSIKEDDTIAEMESDKAAFDLPSDASGTVKEIKVSEGDEVKVGQVILTVETEKDIKEEESEEGQSEKTVEDKEKFDEKKDKTEEKEVESEEDKEKNKDVKEAEKEKKKGEEGAEDKGIEGKNEKEKEEEEKEEGEKGEKEKKEKDESISGKDSPYEEVPAAPSVRRLARELGVDIRKVEGTGPYDRIMADDVKSYAKAIVKKSGDDTALGEDYELPDFSIYGETKRESMDSIRKRTATNMTASWQNIPHVFQFDKADVTMVEDFRDRYGDKVEKEGGKLTVTAILLKIVARALETFPKFNASLDFKHKEIIYKKYVNIGVAVDTERGLLVPVIRDADKKSITELSVELGEIAEKARNKKIMPDELQGGNFAISNLGGIGGTNFTPIVYRPNVAILGVSRSEVQPVYIDDEFEPRLMLPLSLSYDHRLIDGAEASRFLRWICESLENPMLTMF